MMKQVHCKEGRQVNRSFRPVTILIPILFYCVLSRAVVCAAVTTVILAARVIDGTGHPAMENATLVFQGERIINVGPKDTIRYPSDATIIHAEGQTIIPGLISSHSHLGLVDGATVAAANYNRANITRQLLQYESYGVTSVMALGLNDTLFYQLRDEQRQGHLSGADMFGADRGIGAPSGAPPSAQIPVAPDQIYRPSSPEEAKADVREMANRHPDLIKVWIDDLLGTVPKMSPEIYKAVIDESHRLGFRVAAHIYYLEDAKRLLRAGVDIIAHGVRDQPVDDEMIALLKSRPVFYIPTIQLDESSYIYAESPDFWNEPFFQAALQPALKKHLQDPLFIARTKANPNLPIFKASVANNKKNLKTIFDAGVKVSMGTDSGAVPLRIPGFAEHRELQLMVDAGLTPMQAIQVATRNAAEAIGISDRGTLVRDKLADFIVLSANPLDNIKNTEAVVSVWHRGIKVHGPVTGQIGG